MLLNKIWSKWFRRTQRKTEHLPDTISTDPGISHQRAMEWIGQDRLERHQFYEKWVSQETWLVYAEGLPLLLGRDPEAGTLEQDDELREQRRLFWEHLQRCVQQRLPPFLNNPGEKPDGWRAAPVELYRWAVAARVPMPEELETLLAFVSTTVATYPGQSIKSVASELRHDKPETESLAREQVLSALLSLSLQGLHQASGRDGDALRDELLVSLYEKSTAFFKAQQPPLSKPALHDLIDRSLEAAGLYRC